MRLVQIAPTLIVGLSIISACGYAIAREWNQATYWVGASILGIAIAVR